MKRTLSFMVMALALLLTQCRKPEVKFPTPSSAEGVTVSMTVTAGPGSKTDITDAGVITWSSGDKLYVGDGTHYVGYLTLQGTGGSARGTFTGEVTLTDASDGEKTFHFFYLGNAKDYSEELKKGISAAVEVSFATQTGLRENLGSCHIGYGSAKGTVAGSEVTGINVTLVSKVALACFSFKKSGTSEGYSGALTLSGDNIYNSMTVNFNGSFTHGEQAGNISLTDTENAEKYVMLVPAGAGSATLNFGGEYEGFTELAQGIEANKFYGRETAIVVNLTKVPVPVTGVTVDPTELNLVAGGTGTLTAAVTPENADDKNVTWSSSNESVATVSDGLVTAVAAGSATITVTTVDGSKTATCAVTVTAAPAAVFTVAAGTTVEFSPGNLYWDGKVFRFEANQLSFASTWDENHVSHFYWSKTASVAYAQDYSESGTSTSDVFFTNATETTANSGFQVEGEEAGTWRTLSIGEWDYLLNKWGSNGRSDVNRFAKARVNYVNGLLIFPDGYNGDEPVSGITGIAEVNNSSVAFPDGNIPTDTWTSMGLQGVVFLPAAGYRGGGKPGIEEPIIIDPIRAAGGGSDISDTNRGFYWSSSLAGSPGGALASALGIAEDHIGTSANDVLRSHGHSVRLVK